MLHATLEPGAQLRLPWRPDFNALAYVLAGSGTVGAEKRPGIVWTYGGGFTGGAGSLAMYNGETLLVRSRVPDYLAGRPVAELYVPGEIGVVEVSTAGHSRIPEPSPQLRQGDVVSFIVAAGSLRTWTPRRPS